MTAPTLASVIDRLEAATEGSLELPRRGDCVVDTVSGRTLIWLEAVGNSFNPHCMTARLLTMDGWHWTKRTRQLRRPMPGESRAALRARALLDQPNVRAEVVG